MTASNLQIADFSNANLVGLGLYLARYDEKTVWPDEFDPTNEWVVEVVEEEDGIRVIKSQKE